MTGSSHPRKKQAHLQKPRGVRRGLGKRRLRERSLRSLFPLRQCGKAGRPARPAIQPRSVHGASREQCGVGEDSDAPGGAGSSGDILQLGGLAENEHCAGSQPTMLPTFPGAVEKSPFQASVSPALHCGCLWPGMLSLAGEGVQGQKSPGRGPACLPAPGAPACCSSIPEYQ